MSDLEGAPALQFIPVPCPDCGATTVKEAETMCQATSDETGEFSCITSDCPVIDGKLTQPSEESVARHGEYFERLAKERGW